MPLNASLLATEMRDGILQSDPPSPNLDGMAADIVSHLQTAVVSNPLVLGVASPSGGPLIPGSGTSIGGAMVLVPADLVAKFTISLGPTPEIAGMATALSTFFMTGLVNFPPGTITGTSANTPVSPGPVIGEGNNGIIVGLTGVALAPLISTAIGKGGLVTPELLGLCNAIALHVTANASAAYLTGTIIGTAPPAGGPIVAAGVGGTIS